MRLMTKASLTALALIAAAALHPAAAQESYVLTIKDHKFDPAEIQVPAGKEVTLVVKNMDDTAEEFESETLDVEEVIGGGQEASFKIGPLEAGTYEFVGEFHEDSAKGNVVVQ
jgi:plastocyanin